MRWKHAPWRGPRRGRRGTARPWSRRSSPPRGTTTSRSTAPAELLKRRLNDLKLLQSRSPSRKIRKMSFKLALKLKVEMKFQPLLAFFLNGNEEWPGAAVVPMPSALCRLILDFANAESLAQRSTSSRGKAQKSRRRSKRHKIQYVEKHTI